MGQQIRIRDVPFKVVGVFAPKGQTAEGTDQDDMIIVPYTTAQGVASGTVTYGAAPEGTMLKFPMTGQPTALVSGRQYYLYVLQDIAFPLTRCVFTKR